MSCGPSYQPKAERSAEETLDLGGVTARVIHCPGHTPGSVAVYLPRQELLLSGDEGEFHRLKRMIERHRG